jgi:hypothetical protein
MAAWFRSCAVQCGGGPFAVRAQCADYSSEVLDQWRQEKEQQFEDNWPKAASILAELRRYGIYVADVKPGHT